MIFLIPVCIVLMTEIMFIIRQFMALREILRRSGIVPEVEENVLLDAALRKKPHEDFFN